LKRPRRIRRRTSRPARFHDNPGSRSQCGRDAAQEARRDRGRQLCASPKIRSLLLIAASGRKLAMEWFVRDVTKRPVGRFGFARIPLYFLGLSWISLPARGWKSLDFLGISRPNRAFSMGYREFPQKFFSPPRRPSSKARGAASPWGARPRAFMSGEDVSRVMQNHSTPFDFSETNVERASRWSCLQYAIAKPDIYQQEYNDEVGFVVPLGERAAASPPAWRRPTALPSSLNRPASRWQGWRAWRGCGRTTPGRSCPCR